MKKYKFNFFLVDGKVVVDSEQIKILKNGGFLKEVKTKTFDPDYNPDELELEEEEQ